MSALTKSRNGLFRDLTDQTFGRWYVVGRSEKQCPKGRAWWSCRCECGTTRDVIGSSLVRGVSKSCGCLNREHATAALVKRSTTHGMTGTRAFSIWSGMLDRCQNENSDNYPMYGAKGIRVCDEWRDDFMAFYRAMGPPPDGLTIDRIDTTGNYEPGNCRWATDVEQSRNRGDYNRVLEFGGVRRTVAEWAEVTGITYSAIWQRIEKGWSVERALTQPRRLRRSR